jgi:hypothetical protein
MKHEFDLFEKFPDGSSLWRDSVPGLETTCLRLQELAQRSENQFYALNLTTREVLAFNSERDVHGFCAPLNNQGASKAIDAERRRSERLLLDVPLVVRGESPESKPFQEKTFTISVSAHGTLLVLATKVALGQTLLLRNPHCQDEVVGRVIRFGIPYGGLARVGIDFAQPAPEFWPVESLPGSWRSLRR